MTMTLENVAFVQGDHPNFMHVQSVVMQCARTATYRIGNYVSRAALTAMIVMRDNTQIMCKRVLNVANRVVAIVRAGMTTRTA